jgi:hypothetical protein
VVVTSCVLAVACADTMELKGVIVSSGPLLFMKDMDGMPASFRRSLLADVAVHPSQVRVCVREACMSDRASDGDAWRPRYADAFVVTVT